MYIIILFTFLVTSLATNQPKVARLVSQPQCTSPTDQHKDTPPPGHPQDYAGKSYHFVERPPEGLVCAVCQALSHDPVQANCCGKIFCARCIEEWKTRGNSCPMCRSTEQSDPPFNVFRDRNALQRITSLVVYCPNWKDGCNKKMELSEVEKHVTSVNCFLLSPVECEYKRFGCAVILPRKDIKGHLQSSVENHLRMTMKRVTEMEGRVVELEAQIKEEKTGRQQLEAHLEEVEKKAEAERAEHQLMKVKMEEMNTVIASLEANGKHVKNEPDITDNAAESDDDFLDCI